MRISQLYCAIAIGFPRGQDCGDALLLLSGDPSVVDLGVPTHAQNIVSTMKWAIYCISTKYGLSHARNITSWRDGLRVRSSQSVLLTEISGSDRRQRLDVHISAVMQDGWMEYIRTTGQLFDCYGRLPWCMSATVICEGNLCNTFNWLQVEI